MAKAVLVMDMPEQVCQKCILCYETENEDEYLCCATGKLVPDGEKPVPTLRTNIHIPTAVKRNTGNFFGSFFVLLCSIAVHI